MLENVKQKVAKKLSDGKTLGEKEDLHQLKVTTTGLLSTCH